MQMSTPNNSLTALALTYADESSSDDDARQLMQDTAQGSKVVRLEIDADAASMELAIAMQSGEPVSFRQQYDESASVALAVELERMDHLEAQDAALARDLDFQQHSPERGPGTVIPKGGQCLINRIRLYLIARLF